jgi:dsRNA-specific ribonuclease
MNVESTQHKNMLNENKKKMEDDDANPMNKEISSEEVRAILKRYGLPPIVHNLELYRRSFVHRSYCLKDDEKACTEGSLPLRHKSNERLEFLGDGVLECVTKFYLYRRFSKENEGFMTEKKIALVKNESIGKMALDMGLHQWLNLSKHAEETKTRTNLKKLGCLFEAFLGALFLDFNKTDIDDGVFTTGPGFQAAQVFVETVFETHVDWDWLIHSDDNYKNILQVKVQREFKTTPEYVEIMHNERGYHMGVYLCLGAPIYKLDIKKAVPFQQYGSFAAIPKSKALLVHMGSGIHKIKKKSEQLACESALQQLAF